MAGKKPAKPGNQLRPSTGGQLAVRSGQYWVDGASHDRCESFSFVVTDLECLARDPGRQQVRRAQSVVLRPGHAVRGTTYYGLGGKRPAAAGQGTGLSAPVGAGYLVLLVIFPL